MSASAATSPVPNLYAPAVQALSAWCRALAFDCLWASLWRLPAAIAVGIGTCLALTAVPGGGLLLVKPILVTPAVLTGLAICYALAGALWGAHWTFRFLFRSAFATVETYGKQLIDELFAPLIRISDNRLQKVPIVQVRSYCQDGLYRVVLPVDRGVWYFPVAWLARAFSRWWLRAELDLVERLLKSLESRGESEISFDSLQRFVRDKSIEQFQRSLNVTLWQFDLAFAAIIWVLLALPASLLIGIT